MDVSVYKMCKYYFGCMYFEILGESGVENFKTRNYWYECEWLLIEYGIGKIFEENVNLIVDGC